MCLTKTPIFGTVNLNFKTCFYFQFFVSIFHVQKVLPDAGGIF